MSRTLRLLLWSAASLVAAALWTTAVTLGQTGGLRGTQPKEWSTYGGDLASTRYRPFDQITRGNFNTLEVAWRGESAPRQLGGIIPPRPMSTFNAPKRSAAGRGL
jgi:glucose dehydrogenase